MSTNTLEVLDRGMRCLSDHLGADETEVFIATVLRERMDYTEWRRSLVDSIQTFGDLDRFLAASKKDAAFHGNPQIMM